MKKRLYITFGVRRLHIICLSTALGLGLTGCKTDSNSVEESQGNPFSTHTRIAIELASASSAYYATFGYWPLSLENLRQLQNGQVGADWRENFSNSVKDIPWQNMKGKVTFVEKPDGSLEISVPPLDPFLGGGGGTVTVQKPMSAER